MLFYISVSRPTVLALWEADDPCCRVAKPSYPCRVVGPLRGDSQNLGWEGGLHRPCRPICEGGRVMRCGSRENRPADPSMSLCSTTGVLRRSSSDLSVHRGNGCRAQTKDESLGKGSSPESDCWMQKPLRSLGQLGGRPERGQLAIFPRGQRLSRGEVGKVHPTFQSAECRSAVLRAVPW